MSAFTPEQEARIREIVRAETRARELEGQRAHPAYAWILGVTAGLFLASLLIQVLDRDSCKDQKYQDDQQRNGEARRSASLDRDESVYGNQKPTNGRAELKSSLGHLVALHSFPRAGLDSCTMAEAGVASSRPGGGLQA